MGSAVIAGELAATKHESANDAVVAGLEVGAVSLGTDRLRREVGEDRGRVGRWFVDFLQPFPWVISGEWIMGFWLGSRAR
jgi:hypothetical protein